ncbi:diguanylate cyclase [Candidatus Sulfurimonas marisnigri]|uniref:diguanylate cyclase n=1 Tax=Candidatus Sulfurimonas marisnigri TaxID=2740405 RepID=UPI001E620930|nr:diguanylate cyclase [Candidatus Sulfurimonas marisnigri]
MQRILIVEDNKTLAKLISKKITSELNVKVDIAYNFSESKLFLKSYKYFLTLLDLNLPDAPNGEVVDYALSKDNRVIVLSGNIDKELRKKLLSKNIIDYINKSGVSDIKYIINFIKRLQKNQNHKILVVDDSMVFRKHMKSMLENLFYDVISVAHGEEALSMLKTYPDISLVLTDYNMPVMNGLELTSAIRKTRDKNDISIIALSSNENEEIDARFLKEGANDYINKPFSKEEFSCRVNNSIESLENIQTITNHSNRDFLTGVYNRRYFFHNVQTYFDTALESGESFAIAMIDIDNFKNINDTYGHDSGDKAIVHLSDILRANTAEDDVVSRFGGEEFCIILKNISSKNALTVLERIKNKVQKSVTISEKNAEISFTISVGLVTNHENSLDETVNQADMLLYEAKQSGRNKVISN